jgi:hypothetical protein
VQTQTTLTLELHVAIHADNVKRASDFVENQLILGLKILVAGMADVGIVGLLHVFVVEFQVVEDRGVVAQVTLVLTSSNRRAVVTIIVVVGIVIRVEGNVFLLRVTCFS